MNVVVMGSGGVGGYFGAKLVRSGADVTFVARGAHLDAMRKNGITIRSAIDGEWTVACSATDRIDQIATPDLILFCVKSFDTESCAHLLKSVVTENTIVLSLQNGVDNETKLATLLNHAIVIGGVAYVFSNIESPGVIAHHQLGRIIYGAGNSGQRQQVGRIGKLFLDAGIEAEADDRIDIALWKKYVFLTALSGTTTCAQVPVQSILESAPTRLLWQRQVEELLALAAANNIALPEDMFDQCVKLLNSLAPGNYSSMYQDRVAGKRLELEALHGYAVNLGRSLGIDTLTLDAVYGTLAPHADG